MDIKENFAKNLVLFRKALGITQSELAEKLNYSDKAVSKWERAESVPDIYVIKQIADFFDVKVDVLISEPKPEKKKLLNISKKRMVISLVCATFVWLVAIVTYATLGIIFPSVKRTWLSFIYAVPVSLIILLSITSSWGKNVRNAVFTSLLMWSTILAVFLTLLYTLNDVPANLWMLWLIGLPLQILIAFFFFYKKLNRK